MVTQVNFQFPSNVPASLSGAVVDGNGNALSGLNVTLTGKDSQGNSVRLTTTTDTNGKYSFAGLAPGTYTLTESAPSGDVVTASPGTVNGTKDGTGNFNQISAITLASGNNGSNYNFADVFAGS